MRWKQPAQVISSFALGFLAAALVGRIESPALRADEVGVHTRVIYASKDNSTLHAEYEQRIADLTLELETLRRFASASSPDNPETPTKPVAGNVTQEAFQSLADSQAKGRAILKQHDTDRLLAAGFSMERIEWIRRRADELRIDVERRLHEGKGGPMSLAYMYEQDLDLRNDIGEEEYDRYREALGRPAGVGIEQVQPTSSAEGAGLRSGDQVIGYAGKRVYNEPMLTSLIAAGGTSGVVTLNVLRSGQKIQIVVPSGPLGVRTVSPFMAAVRARASLNAASSP